MRKIKISEDNTFSTSHLPLAAFLLIHYQIKFIDLTNPKKVVFVFEKDSNFETLTDKYWKGESLVDPIRYFQNLKVLKSKIYNL